MARFTFGNKGSDGAECGVLEVVGPKSSSHAGGMVSRDLTTLQETGNDERDHFPESNQVISSQLSSALIIRQMRKEGELMGNRARMEHSRGSNTLMWCNKLFHPSPSMKQVVLPLLTLGGSMRKRPNETPGRTSVGRKEEMLGEGNTTSMRQLMPSPTPLAVRKGVKELAPKMRHLMPNQVQLTPSAHRTNAYHIGSRGEFSSFLIDYATHVSFLCAVSLDLRSNPFEEGGDDASMARTWSMELDKELGAKVRSMEQHGTKLKEAARIKEEEASCRELIKLYCEALAKPFRLMPRALSKTLLDSHAIGLMVQLH